MTGRPHLPQTVAAISVCTAVLALSACGGASSGTHAATPSGSTVASSTSAAVSLPPANPAALERVVPEPAAISATAGTFTLTSGTAIHASSGAEPVAADLASYLKQQTGLALQTTQAPPTEQTTQTGQTAPPTGGAGGSIQLVLMPAGSDPALGAEGYTLAVTPGSVTLSATGDAGLFHGVQTIRQLLVGTTLQNGTVTDHPRFGYRGVMLDVARHFLSVADVKAYIDAAALYKVNEFHLHLTDDQGWRFPVADWPKLAAVGGATQVGGGAGGSYSAAQLKEIVDYASSRYMTVIPEIDMPGHVGAAVYAYPELSCDGRHHGPVTSVSPGFDALCTSSPSSTSTYRFVDSATKAAADATPGPFLHMGGDEAQALNLTQYNGFVQHAQNLVAEHGRTPIAWAEAGTAPLLPQTVLEYWNTAQPQPYVGQAAAKGTKLIMAPGDHAYLDQQPVAGFPLGLHWAGYVPVSKAYAWDPVTVLPGVAPTAVLGVEAPLWSETVKSLADAETLAFPRLPAIAEIGWSTPETHDWARFSQRLAAQGALWDKVGIAYYKSPEVPWGRG